MIGAIIEDNQAALCYVWWTTERETFHMSLIEYDWIILNRQHRTRVRVFTVLSCWYHDDIMVYEILWDEWNVGLPFVVAFPWIPRFSLGTTSKTMIGPHVPCKVWALPRGHRVLASSVSKEFEISIWHPRAMLVTKIGGARPPNEIVLD